MKKIIDSIALWWFLHVRNRTERKGEGHGYWYRFRRYTLEIGTQSGNFRARFTASEHPYGYLNESLEQGNEDNVFGFIRLMYYLGASVTDDKELCDAVVKALNGYGERLLKEGERMAKEADDEPEGAILDFEKSVSAR